MRVQRYQLKPAEGELPIFGLTMPRCATLLGVHVQGGTRRCFLFALIDPLEPCTMRTFRAYETGEPIPELATFVCTFQASPLFWHLFELHG